MLFSGYSEQEPPSEVYLLIMEIGKTPNDVPLVDVIEVDGKLFWKPW